MHKLLLSVMVAGMMTATVPQTGAAPETPSGAPALAQGNTAFALDLYRQVCGGEGNLFFSPYSVSTVLAMTVAGARGVTAAEMMDTLRVTRDQERLHPAFQALAGHLARIQDSGDVALRIANSLWPQDDEPLREAFLSLAETFYGVSITPVDYKTAADAARVQINRWVEAQTEEKIKDLIPAGVLGPLVRLVLVNAIYFKGDWARQFDADRTADAAFRTAAGPAVTVPLMSQQADFPYGELESLQLLELPYRGDALSMLIVLPAMPDGLARLEESLTPEKLAQWRQALRTREVQVFLPRFKMTASLNLNEPLGALGMEAAFDPSRADFSGISGPPGWLFIDSVLHKAFVEVNEEGTEAAAATGVVMRITSLPQPPPVFRADRPFLFLIQERETGSVLFMGRIADPSESGQ